MLRPALLSLGFLTMPTLAQPFQASVFVTAKDAKTQLAPGGTFTSAQPGPAQATIFLDDAKTFQTIVGIGGAITDASAEVFAKLPPDKQRELIAAYFDPKTGIGYSLIRTNIHSCDFSSASYTYVAENDTALASFSVAPDLKHRIPMIKRAMEASGGGSGAGGKEMTVYASPWSPPAWMKTNGNMLQGGELKPEFASTWANYYIKFIEAYEKQGIPIFGVSVQNEPAAVQRWESCIYTAEQERDFVKNHLGPALVKAGMLNVNDLNSPSSKKIIVWDHNRDIMYERAKVVLEDPAAAKYIWGVGFHWYVGDHFENVRLVQERFPETHLLFTEGCVESFDRAKVSEWGAGERYGRSLFNDFNNGAVGWTDWNILLDEKGGPNHVGNFCFAPVHADIATGELTYMNSFYYLGHFSKFVRPGAKRITASNTSDELLSVAFKNPDGSIAVVMMNQTEKAIEVNIQMGGQAVKAKSEARSIVTAVVRR
ncbi:MAG: glycoside hydrolase family 30 protein [Phycisphaerae bacterium]|nr:glycoside hydrolase family 30 protein [Phycisphaerae bacterium]